MKILQEVDKGTKERWDTLRKMYTKSARHSDHENSVDWDAVRCAQVSEIAKAIANRGQHNIIAGRIKVEKYVVVNSNFQRVVIEVIM